jgi:hypothetical protein
MCMMHVAMHNARCQHAPVSGSVVLAVLLFFFKTQLPSNGLVHVHVSMNLRASNKLEPTDKATVTY